MTMEAAYNNQDSKLKMGKLRRALRKVFCCFFPWASSKSKISPDDDDDVYEPSTSKTQTVPTSLSRETKKVFATETQKPRKSFIACLKAKTQMAPTPSSRETEKVFAVESLKPRKRFFACLRVKNSKKTLPAQLRPTVLLGGAAMISGNVFSEDSDEVYLPAAQRNTTFLEKHFGLQRTPSITSVESFYYSEEDGLFSSNEYESELDDVSGDFDAPFIYSISSNDTSHSHDTSHSLLVTSLDPGIVRELHHKPILSVLGDISVTSLEEEDSDGFTQEEILQLIESSNEPSNNQQRKDYDGQDFFNDQPVNMNYMGFPNIGNTCYMNSTLQCLFSITPIIEDIIYQENLWKNVPGSKMLRAFYDLHYARLNRTQNTQRTQLLTAVKHCIALRNPDFDGSYQQDAHEFLMALVAQLKDEAEMCQKSEKTFRNPVSHLEFIVNRLRTCKTCGKQSCSTEDVNCLSLLIGPQKSLIESLQQYFASSELECRCVRCHGTEASESVEIQTLPRVLVLLMTRFDMLTARKIKGCLMVPEELSLSSCTESDSCEQAADLYSKEAKDTQQAYIETNTIQKQADTTYKLNGVVSHHGTSMHCGHYDSNIRNPYGVEWLSCDDGTVKAVKWSNVYNTIENHGYMFFYVRSCKKSCKKSAL